MVFTKNIAIIATILIGAVLFFGLSGADIWVQGHFYNPLTQQWMVDSNDKVLKFIFYDGIKRLLIIIAVLMLFGSIAVWKRSFFQLFCAALLDLILQTAVFQ